MSKITSEQGWHQLTRAMSRQMPKHLRASEDARRAMRKLMTGKGRR
jgi:hypothetical protein